MSAREFRNYAEAFLDRSASIAQNFKGQADKIAAVMEILFTAWLKKSWVFIFGNGGSASTATHFAADLVKTVVEKPGDPGLKAVTFDNGALNSALINDWGWEKLFDAQLATFWEPESVVVAISVNGGVGSDKVGVYSQNLLRALEFAKKNGGRTIGFVGDKYAGGKFKDICDVCVIVPDGSTPQVESFHVLLTHLITFGIKEKIKKEFGSV